MTKNIGLFAASAALLMITPLASFANIRPIFTPGNPSAIIMMQAMDATSGGTIDPEPRALYDAIAQAPKQSQGGIGKAIALGDKSFSLTCVTKSDNINVFCTIVVKNTARSQVSAAKQTAEVRVSGPDAETLYNEFAGSSPLFRWASANHWIFIESTPDHFWFKFATHPSL